MMRIRLSTWNVYKVLNHRCAKIIIMPLIQTKSFNPDSANKYESYSPFSAILSFLKPRDRGNNLRSHGL